ncbi:MAG TPA: hypothetical protein VFJ91_00395 [Gaiellaceae bacterium]|nr:hypothetical protein [Gaiellaceae bacterium]
MARAVVPEASGWKRFAVLLIVPLFAAACGSSGGASTTASASARTVTGPGFRFSVPAGWRVRHDAQGANARSPGNPAALVSAATFRLGKTYAPADFAAATKELDGVAARLARAAGGTVTESETTTVDGRKVRAYRFDAKPNGAGAYADRVGFVLAGKREVQLLCQAPADAGDPDGACALLFSSFTLTD